MTKKVVQSSYVPREVFVPFHARKERYAVVVAHRRCGKTVAAVNDLIDKAMHCPLNRPMFGYIAPFYAQAKSIAWEYLKDFTKDICIEQRESELCVIIHSAASNTPAKIRLFGSDNPNALRGMYFDGVVIDEYGQCSPSLYGEVIRPALSDRKGWCVFLGTPAGPNHFYDLFRAAKDDDEWLRMHLPVSATHLIDEQELASARKQLTEDEYEVEFEASFEASVPGAIYARDLAKLGGHLDQRLAHDRDRAVLTGWDLGISDDTAIVFVQRDGNEYRVIDYLAVSGESIEVIVDLLKEKPYEYGPVYLPHDARSRSLQTGRSLLEQMHSLGVRNMRVVPQMPVSHGIQAVRQLLPSMRFCKDKCKELITALQLYQREYDPVRKVFRPAPRHDWTSHPADAVRTLACGLNPKIKQTEVMTTKKKVAPSLGAAVTPMNLHTLWEERDGRRRSNEHRI